MSLEKRFEALIKNYEEVRSQNEHLRKQLAKSMGNQRKNLYSTPSHESSESEHEDEGCLLYTSPSPRDGLLSRMPSSA